MFREFKKHLQAAIAKMETGQNHLFVTDASPDLMWETYLQGFPEDIRQEYNCSACRQFLKRHGAIVAIKDNKMVTMWQFETIDTFQPIVNKLHEIVMASKVVEVFVSDTQKLGLDYNHETLESGEIRKWEHMFYLMPKHHVFKDRHTSIDARIGSLKVRKETLGRALRELTTDAVETVLELINQGSVYRGAEFKETVKGFLAEKKDFEKVPEEEKELYIWSRSVVSHYTGIRNSAIGTLLVDVSEGIEPLDTSLEKFGRKMDPMNYRRPTVAAITPAMKKAAEEKLVQLGLENSLGRRSATIDDIGVNDVLFINRDPKKVGSLLDDVLGGTDAKVDKKKFDKVEEITIDKFISDVLPTAKNIELLVEGDHVSNFMTLIAPKHKNSPSLFRWNNGFSWSYKNATADSMKEKVKAAGGSVEGQLRVSLEWHNHDDLDVYLRCPDNETVYYGHRTHSRLKAQLDVDANNGNLTRTPVENIIMPYDVTPIEGVYDVSVNQYSRRESTGIGYTVEIEVNGQIHRFVREKNPSMKATDRIASIRYSRANGFEVIGSSDVKIQSKTVWGVQTNTFQKVSSVMYSPNYWEGEAGTGNKHFFFIVENMKSEEEPRGFFNEFLKPELNEHKRIFEALGARMAVERNEQELAGVGFSSTKKESIIVKVEGAFSRVLKVNI